MVKEESKIVDKKQEKLTLASAFERIYEDSCASNLSPEFYDTCNEALNYVHKQRYPFSIDYACYTGKQCRSYIPK